MTTQEEIQKIYDLAYKWVIETGHFENIVDKDYYCEDQKKQWQQDAFDAEFAFVDYLKELKT